MMQSRVRNILVEQVDSFTDALAWWLAREQISYVQIGNEFHFLDRIYRFYEFDQYKEFLRRVDLSSDCADLLFGGKTVEGESIAYDGGSSRKNVPHYNKRMVQQDSRSVKQLVKGSLRGNKFY